MKHRNTKQTLNEIVEAKLDEIREYPFEHRETGNILENSIGFETSLNGRKIDNFINGKKKKKNSEKFSNFFEEKGRKEGRKFYK